MATATTALALSPHDKAVGVQPEQKPNRAIHTQEQTQANQGNTAPTPAFVTPPQPASQQGDASQHRDSGEQEGTEFWPTFMGYKFKITDSLIALSTLALTVFTGLLWRSTEKLWSAGERQIGLARESTDLARLALESAETPYLIPVVSAFDESVDPPPPSPSMRPLVSICFENCGRSPAIMREFYCFKTASRKTPDALGFPPPQINIQNSSILPVGYKSSPARYTESAFDGWQIWDQSRVPWLIGYTRYADVFGNQFFTGFCYCRGVHNGKWWAQGGPRYNYRRKLTPDEQRIADSRDGGDLAILPLP